MSLARELGHGDVDAMLAGMSGRQLTEWMAFARLDADGAERRPAEGSDAAMRRELAAQARARADKRARSRRGR